MDHSATHGSRLYENSNTLRSTRIFATGYIRPMKPEWQNWHERAKATKEMAKAAGRPLSDVDVAASVSELLEAAGQKPVKRALVNHWLNGRRIPSLVEFFALCHVLQMDPRQVLFGDTGTYSHDAAGKPTAAPPPFRDPILDDLDSLLEEDREVIRSKVRARAIKQKRLTGGAALEPPGQHNQIAGAFVPRKDRRSGS